MSRIRIDSKVSVVTASGFSPCLKKNVQQIWCSNFEDTRHQMTKGSDLWDRREGGEPCYCPGAGLERSLGWAAGVGDVGEWRWSPQPSLKGGIPRWLQSSRTGYEKGKLHRETIPKIYRGFLWVSPKCWSTQTVSKLAESCKRTV